MTSTAVSPDERAQKAALDVLRIFHSGVGIDVDSNNDGTVDGEDDPIEELRPGAILAASGTATPNVFPLVLCRHQKWASLSEPVAKLYRDGRGAFEVLDENGATVLAATAESATLAASAMDGQTALEYSIRMPNDTTVFGEPRLRLEIESGGQVVARDWVQLSTRHPEYTLDSIEFVSDYQEAGANLLKRSPQKNFRNVGAAFERVEWTTQAPAQNNPIAHKMATKVTINVRIKVEPSDTEFELVGDAEHGCMDFHSGPRESTGDFQEVEITADDPLPNRCIRVNETVRWTLLVAGGSPAEVELNTSGPHELLVTAGPPTELNSWEQTNSFAHWRVRELVENAGIVSSTENIASSIQEWRDNYATLRTTPTCGFDGDKIWALLDKTEAGQCAEGALLMEQALRLLGISTPSNQLVLPTYQHVLPSDVLPVPVYYVGDQAARSPSRTNSAHGNERLWMYFANAPAPFTGWNIGEGCCRVGDRLYASYAGLKVGVPGGEVNNITAQTAEHHMLLLLEDDEGGGREAHFQRWRTETGSKAECSDEPHVPVPAGP